MEYYFAPMEGVTGAIFRTVHHRYFPQADAYYMPFLSPTQDHVFTPRELRNVLEFSAYLTPSGVITCEAFPADLRRPAEHDAALPLVQRVRAFEKREIQRLLARNGASLEGKKKTAAQLGISLASLYNKLNAPDF